MTPLPSKRIPDMWAIITLISVSSMYINFFIVSVVPSVHYITMSHTLLSINVIVGPTIISKCSLIKMSSKTRQVKSLLLVTVWMISGTEPE